jgi:hypothetical protein
LRCEIRDQPLIAIWCDVLENEIFLEDISLNRGNCKSPKEHIQWILNSGGKDPQNNSYYPFDKKYIFGDKFWIHIFSCKTLEYSIRVNGSWWTWKIQ